MKRQIACLMSVLLSAACVAAAGVAVARPYGVGAAAAEETAAEAIEVVEQLEWEGTPACGWGSVLKNQHCEGRPLIVNGVTYDRNSIGSHLPASNVPQDIVYDISAYSEEYPYFTMMVAQPDGALNSVKFSVLVDDVVADSVIWTHADNTAEGANDNSVTPTVMRAYVKGASKLTLRAEWNRDAFSDGALAFLDVKLQKQTQGYVYANRILSRADATEGGWDFGYGKTMLYDRQIDNRPFDYMVYADHLVYDEGLGVHLKDVSYEVYENDKSNAGAYVSLRWDISAYDFSYFSTLVYMQLGYGSHVDIWIDGEEAMTSGKIDSVGTLDATGKDARLAPQEVGVAIPSGAENFEIRVVADTLFNDGMVNLLAPVFFERSDKLVSRYAEQTAAAVFPYETVRSRAYDGSKTEYYVAETNEDIVSDDAFFFLAESEQKTATSYRFDISDVTFNSLVGVLGRASYYREDHSDAAAVELRATVEYADGKTETLSSDPVDWTNSGEEVLFKWGEGAQTLTLWLYAEDPAFSDSVFAGAYFRNTRIAEFELWSGNVLTLSFADGAALLPPEAPERAGYTFAGFALKGEDTAYDFADKTIVSDMQFTALWTANSYTISYEEKLGDDAAQTVEYGPKQYVFDQGAGLPTARAIEGYDFVGWYVGDTKVETLAAETYTSDITVTAVYRLESAAVVFRDGDDILFTKDVVLGQTIGNVETPQKTGYTFAGWVTEDETAFDPETPVTADITLYATWTANEYAITYQEKLGENPAQSAQYEPVQYVFDRETVLPTARAIEGYDFVGWYVGDTKVEALAAKAYTADITVTAVYALKEFAVVFRDGETELSLQRVVWGGFAEEISAGVKKGYTFAGWKDGADNAFDFATPVTSDLVLTAQWKANEYAITYRQALGSAESAAEGYTPATHVYGTDTALPAAKEITGYTFDGWYVNGEKITVLGGTQYLDPITVVAKYKINTYEVSFSSEDIVETVSYDYGMTVTERTPEREGYTFAGWYTDAECTQAYDFTAKVTGDLTLYAKWEKNVNVGLIVGVSCAAAIVAAGAAAAAVILVRKKKK